MDVAGRGEQPRPLLERQRLEQAPVADDRFEHLGGGLQPLDHVVLGVCPAFDLVVLLDNRADAEDGVVERLKAAAEVLEAVVRDRSLLKAG